MFGAQSDSDSSINGTPPGLKSTANSAVSELVPEKSKKQYEKCYNDFKDWCNSKGAKTLSENVLLAYLKEKSETLKSSSLWSVYSMLKCMLNVKEGIDVRRYLKLVPFLKKKSVGYRAKKSKVLTHNQIKMFLEEASDESNLMWKVVLIMGISGAMRRDELTKMTIEDIKDCNDVLIVTVPDTKTDINRTFTITNPDYIRLYRKYAALRPKHVTSRRLFLRYELGKCHAQVVGVHTIGKMPCLIAKHLKLPDSEQYTGHCFRRSSATLLADSGASTSVLKRHGGWRSTAVAESYVEESIENKNKIANSISGIKSRDNLNPGPSASTSFRSNENQNSALFSNQNACKALDLTTSGVTIASNNKCTININVYPRDL